ncbi:DMT family transporter [Lachnospiraceae bacterium KGMB03038]|nr:DMT family transporter [Lachnospiraceae bacterium KGMB03038]
MRTKNACMLILTAFIWGTAFVAQSVGMDHLGPFTFNGVRNLIGGAALLPCIFFLERWNRKDQKKESGQEVPGTRKDLITGGIACGLLLFAASSLQQIGLVYTSAGKAGFITAFYIVIVPVLGIFLHQKAGWKIWAAVAAALAGLYLLCITDGFSVNIGDFYVLLCALLFSLHILVIDHFAPKVDGVKMSCIQFFVCGIVSLVPMFLWEEPRIEGLLLSWFPLLYAGVLSCGVAYTLQIVGQKNVNPTVASLLLSLESCFSVLAGWIILGERLSLREGAGCILMFAAIVLAQLPERKEKLQYE